MGKPDPELQSQEAKADQERRLAIKRLRERTALPLLTCRDALEATGYDEERAWWFLYKLHHPRRMDDERTQ